MKEQEETQREKERIAKANEKRKQYMEENRKKLEEYNARKGAEEFLAIFCRGTTNSQQNYNTIR